MNDIIRPKIWNDKNIDFWYRQNTVVFSSIEKDSFEGAAINPIDFVLPELYLTKLTKKQLSLSHRIFRRLKNFITISI